MIFTYIFRVFAVMCLVALSTNVYKHGWHAGSLVTGAFLTVLMFSLGVTPERRTVAWAIRYVVAIATVVCLAAFRFLR